ncbi:MAG TPA: ABC transporter ATP-binding protein [Ktedonobacterales bacterium]|nr:ABC transporter ATP-binding protein [Ktedonobacterales bacterium]
MKTVRAVQGYMLRHWLILSFGLVLIIIANLIILVPALILQRAIDGISHGADARALTLYALQIVGIAIVAGGFQFLSRFVVNSVARRVEYEMRRDLFRHFQRMDVAYFQERKIGDLVARATNDLSQVRQMLGPGIQNLANSTVAIIVTGIAMVTIDPRLTLYSLTVMPLMSVFFVLVSGSIHRRYRLVQDQFGEVSARAQENFSGIRVVKAYAQEQAELDGFNRINAEYVRRAISFARVNSLLWPAMYFISGLAVAVLLWRGGVDVITGRITLGRLVQFNTYLAALAWPMIALGWTVNLVQQGSASLSRITEVREAIPAIANAPEASPDAAPTRGEIEFRHVSFSYGERETLHDISIHVPAGSSLAIVGPTGAGKSTIVNLLARVYDVTSGAVLIDGHDVRDIPLEELRRAIGYVPQENFLFSLSIRENVGFGASDLTEEELARALDISQLANDVADFPDDVATMIGERGVTLSGGQKQRAGIARAIAKDPLILILDDSLSSVDTHTEAAILKRLRGVMEGRTSIVIAHRISTIKDLDQIVVLDEGRIVERGSHLALLALGGLYAGMYRRQLLAEEMEEDEPDIEASARSSLERDGARLSDTGREGEEG